MSSIREAEPVEIVVVDDGSTDKETLAALDRVRASGGTVVRHDRNRGAAAAKNTGLAETRAPYVVALDADDLAVAGSVAAMADRLESEPGAVACFGDYAEFGASDVIRAVPARLDPYRVAYTNEYPAFALFRREALEAVGGWQADGYRGFAHYDWSLWMSLAERGLEGVHVGRGLVTYRRRVQPPGRGLGAAGRQRHRELYAELRRVHPRLFSGLGSHRRDSDLSRMRKLLYPVAYGGRRRFAFEGRLKPWLDRLGLWTLRR